MAGMPPLLDNYNYKPLWMEEIDTAIIYARPEQ